MTGAPLRAASAEEASVKFRVLIAAAMIAGAATACGRNAGVESGQVQPASGEATVNVANNYMLSMSVYAVDNNNVTRKLGTVGPGMSETYTIDPGIMRMGMVRIYAQPTGGGRVVSTGPLPLAPGNVVDFDIAADLINTITSMK